MDDKDAKTQDQTTKKAESPEPPATELAESELEQTAGGFMHMAAGTQDAMKRSS